MSIALFLCPCVVLAATVLSLVIGVPAARRLWAGGRRLGAVLTVPAAVVTANAIAVGLLYLTLRSHTGFGRGPGDAELAQLELPGSASDVNFWRSSHLGPRWIVDFKIAEPAFLTWAQGRGWKPRKFATGGDGNGRPAWTDADYVPPKDIGRGMRDDFPSVKASAAREWAQGARDQVKVRNGYYFDTYRPPPAFDDSGWTIIYDLERSRAYLTVTAF